MAMSRFWCLTLNNPLDDEIKTLRSCESDYLVLGSEVGESGTSHIQGYIIFRKNKRFSAVQKLCGRAHWEISRGTPQQASDYCKKDGKFEESGTLPLPRGHAGGAATLARFSAARELAISGRVSEIDADLLTKYYRTYKQMRLDSQTLPSDADDVTGVWFYGPPGSGKSRKARELYPGAYLKVQNKWWDGYDGQEHVILDDLDSPALGHLLKIWADRYAFQGETKGGGVCIRPKTICVTSNYSISELFKDDPVLVDAVTRRFKVTRFGAVAALFGSGAVWDGDALLSD